MRALLARIAAGLVAAILVVTLVATLVANAVGYLLDGLTVALGPLIGQANALLVSGLLCLVPLLLILRSLQRSLRKVTQPTPRTPRDYSEQLDDARELIQRYPLEAAALALASGMAAESPETRKLLKSTTRSWLERQASH